MNSLLVATMNGSRSLMKEFGTAPAGCDTAIACANGISSLN
jgi:hypothetical protein